jgi:hypothetical protein
MIARWWKSLPSSPLDRRDACLIVGAGSVVYGAGLIYAPAGWIVAGVMLLTVWALPFTRRKG